MKAVHDIILFNCLTDEDVYRGEMPIFGTLTCDPSVYFKAVDEKNIPYLKRSFVIDTKTLRSEYEYSRKFLT